MQTQDKIGEGDGRAREVTGRMVFLCLVAFFAVVAGVNAIMIRAAVSTFGGVETENAYQAGLAFEAESAAAHTQDSLHWQVAAHVTAKAQDASAIEVTARDAAGAPLNGISVSAEFQHPANRRFDHAVALKEISPGRFAGAVAPVSGQWDLVIEIERGGARVFRSKNRIFVR